MQLHLLSTRDDTSKMQTLVTTVQRHYSAGDLMLLALPHAAAATYVDKLLWRFPPESFIPHGIAPTSERITITTTQRNPEQIAIVFNLCPTPFLDLTGVTHLYDFNDTSTAEKAALSQQRQEAYKKADLDIVPIPK